MIMLRHLFIYTIFAVLVFPFSACKQQQRYRIGVSQCSRDDWRSKMNDEINREIMFHENAMVEIRSADDSNAKQISDIRYFADNGFDIIIVAPNEAEALTPIIKEVYERGIPVLIFDRDINADTYTARLGVDNAGIGKAAAHYARNLVPTGAVNVLEVQGRDGSSPTADRHKGFVDAIAGERAMAIVATGYGNWNKQDAIPLVDSLLAAHPETNLIYAHNDRMAIGASEVARARGRGDIKIIGIDAAPGIGIKAVADSVIDATFLYPTEGHRLIRIALDILEGRPYDKEIQLPLSSAVDLSNADILLLQNESLREETDKMAVLKSQVDEYWERHSAQTTLFYASLVIVVLLAGVMFLLMRSFWQHKRHQKSLLEQNELLRTERDKQRVLNTRLEEATQSKLMFFTNVSHDLRTPLTLISEPVEQLAKAANLTPQQHGLMEIAARNVKILKRLINEILDFRKYENGKMQVTLTECRFGALVDEWCESFLALARTRRMKLQIDIAPEVAALELAIDVEKIERVFFNLMSNAFKYTSPGGSITFTAKTDDDDLTFSVADTGEGIAPDDLGNVFERFFQVDKVHPRGSGIGLSLAKAFVELHGGTVAVESTRGVGSVFTVRIPVRHVEQNAEVCPVAADSAQRRSLDVAEICDSRSNIVPDGAATATAGTGEAVEKPLLLVIDDNADLRAMLSSLMADEYQVVTASDGAQGVKLATRYVPDLVICDVMMPGMDGLECCRMIKAELSTSHIPVLMLTACSMDEQRVEGYASGADGYLAKPFNSEVLLARCRSLIANRKRIKNLLVAQGAAVLRTNDAVANRALSSAKPQVKTPGDIDSEFYARFVEIVNAEMANSDLGVDELAGRMGLGRSQFYRKIKALTNFSPVELLREMRLQRARAMLTGTEKSVSEIAYETGFSTPAYFTKCFRDAFGETPSDLRSRLAAKC